MKVMMQGKFQKMTKKVMKTRHGKYMYV